MRIQYIIENNAEKSFTQLHSQIYIRIQPYKKTYANFAIFDAEIKYENLDLHVEETNTSNCVLLRQN